MTKTEEQYKVNPRRDKNTKDQSLSEKQNDLTKNIGKNHYAQRINKLKLDKQDMENKLESYRSQLQSVEIDINIKEEYIQKLESQINQYQKELTQLRQESLKLTENQTLQVGQEINLMTEQQNLRDRRNEKQLEQTISFSNLNSYAELHQQYRVEYDRMKNSISRLQHNKQNQLKQTQDEKVEIENQLAILRGNLRNNRRKLTKFNDERLELLKEEIILNEDIIQKTQQEEQHEHEHEIN
ncbi:unnamed protein product [Rotaria magnacalcarata]|uniref:Uncharacterized protein n=1 Tax=Rotaria magnacalcarata TaxID=392030 RepID=A0A816SB98_9BILA|nr:unnamed protein product [Rotaria magnacalcarata]CAF4721905.1 unnamed protein product [Rotaria magnacalcarata]